MTNSMNSSMKNPVEDLKEQLTKHYGIESFEEPTHLQVAFDIGKESVLDALAFLKSQGFGQLSILTCIDWMEQNQFQLVYILFNWQTAVHLQLRTFIDRDKPVFKTIEHIYPGVKYYERDVHEFFGVEFEGNEESYKHLFLEMWTADPPMRKDFDPVKYSDEKFSMREYDKDFTNVSTDKTGGK